MLGRSKELVGKLEGRQRRESIAAGALGTGLKIAAQGLPTFVVYQILDKVARNIQGGGGNER